LDVLEESMGGKHLVITYILMITDQVIQTSTLIYWGATGIAFINIDFVHNHHLGLNSSHSNDKLKILTGDSEIEVIFYIMLQSQP